MVFRPPQSLRIRLWLVIALACLPVFLLAFADYHERRQEAVASLRADIQAKLQGARRTAEEIRRSMRQIFQIMARADNLHSFDRTDCSNLAKRLLESIPEFSDLGATLPDGLVFCSAADLDGAPISMADRGWFQEAQAGHDISKAYFVESRILHRQAMVYSYPVRAEDGQLLAVLFATLPMTWLDHLAQEMQLPEGWNLLVFDERGHLLTYHPAAQRPAQPSAQAFAPFRQALQQHQEILEINGLDGHRRMYAVASTNRTASATPLCWWPWAHRWSAP